MPEGETKTSEVFNPKDRTHRSGTLNPRDVNPKEQNCREALSLRVVKSTDCKHLQTQRQIPRDVDEATTLTYSNAGVKISDGTSGVWTYVDPHDRRATRSRVRGIRA